MRISGGRHTYFCSKSTVLVTFRQSKIHSISNEYFNQSYYQTEEDWHMPIESSQYFIILFRVNKVFTFYHIITVNFFSSVASVSLKHYNSTSTLTEDI